MKTLIKVLTLGLILLISPELFASDCIGKHERRIAKLAPNSPIKTEFATAICKYLSPLWRDFAIIIASIESNIKQINSKSGDDIGIVQIHVREIERRGLYIELLETNINYQVLVFRDIMQDKYRACHKRYPTSWQACYHSATPKHHTRYNKLFQLKYQAIRTIK